MTSWLFADSWVHPSEGEGEDDCPAARGDFQERRKKEEHWTGNIHKQTESLVKTNIIQ